MPGGGAPNAPALLSALMSEAAASDATCESAKSRTSTRTNPCRQTDISLPARDVQPSSPTAPPAALSNAGSGRTPSTAKRTAAAVCFSMAAHSNVAAPSCPLAAGTLALLPLLLKLLLLLLLLLTLVLGAERVAPVLLLWLLPSPSAAAASEAARRDCEEDEGPWPAADELLPASGAAGMPAVRMSITAWRVTSGTTVAGTPASGSPPASTLRSRLATAATAAPTVGARAAPSRSRAGGRV